MKTIASKDSPEWFRSVFNTNRHYFDKVGITEQLQQEAVRQQHQGLKKSIRHDASGKVFNRTQVSAETPAWMRSVLETNRPYFEQKGIVDVLRQKPNKTQHNSRKVATAAAKVDSQGQRAVPPGAERCVVVPPGTAVRTALSEEAPEWMKSPAKTAFPSMSESRAAPLAKERRDFELRYGN